MMVKQAGCPPRVFGSNDVDFAQHTQGTQSDVFQVADRGRDHFNVPDIRRGR